MADGNQSPLFETLLEAPPRAGHFIVSLYGDLVEPRGGTLWMGRVIDLCQAAGLSETLVRTAVSRLVAAGQLVGERVGRRSFYRLTAQAQAEFAQAARILFSPPDMPADFALMAMPEDGVPPGFAALRSDLAIGPYRAGLAAEGRFVLRASVDQMGPDLQGFAAGLWDLEPLTARYHVVLARFAPLLAAEASLDPRDALVARLLLVDGYRAALLRDPLLPPAALPEDWPGWAARTLFLRLYLRLSGPADSYVQSAFAENEGLARDEAPQMTARLAALAAEAAALTR